MIAPHAARLVERDGVRAETQPCPRPGCGCEYPIRQYRYQTLRLIVAALPGRVGRGVVRAPAGVYLRARRGRVDTLDLRSWVKRDDVSSSDRPMPLGVRARRRKLRARSVDCRDLLQRVSVETRSARINVSI